VIVDLRCGAVDAAERSAAGADREFERHPRELGLFRGGAEQPIEADGSPLACLPDSVNRLCA
jgi:hypothetical protein